MIQLNSIKLNAIEQRKKKRPLGTEGTDHCDCLSFQTCPDLFKKN